jgi:hypothetical protein
MSAIARVEIYEHGRTRPWCLEKSQGGFDDGMLAGRLARRVERVAMTKRDDERPRRSNAFRHHSK